MKMRPQSSDIIDVEEARKEIELKLECFLETKAKYFVSDQYYVIKEDDFETFHNYISIDNFFFDFIEYTVDVIKNEKDLKTVCMIELLLRYRQITREEYTRLYIFKNRF